MTPKSEHLARQIDWTRPELSTIRNSADPGAAFADQYTRIRRRVYKFEFEEKASILEFLKGHYGAWKPYDTTAAKKVGSLSIEAATKPNSRAMAAIEELGLAWWGTGDPEYGRMFERYYLAAPTGKMFTWGSFNGLQGYLDIGAFFLLLDCPGFSVEGRVAFLDHLHEIAVNAWDAQTSRWNSLMLGPEGHNWWLHGIACLPFVGLLFPEFTRSDFFIRTSWSVIEEHARGHLKSDGGARETTLGYQVYSMEQHWEFYLLALRNGWPVAPGYADTILRGTRFLLRCMTPNGSLPSFGDTGIAPGELTRLAALGAAIAGDGECKWYANRIRQHQSGGTLEDQGQIPLCAFWSVGLAGARTYANTREKNPNHVSVLMGPSGYASLRQTDRSDANYMGIACADRGPVVTSHGHNDIFALDVFARGERFLGEMSCAPYGDSPGRNYDQLTEAHNCLTINGQEQAGILSEWRWSNVNIPAVRRWISEPTHDFFHGVHEGFYQWPKSTTIHARKVLFIKSEPSYWIVLDWIETNLESLDAAAWFHGVVPGELAGNNVVLRGPSGRRLAIVPPVNSGAVGQKVTSPGLEAYIAVQGIKAENYPCFVYRKRTGLDCLAWIISPLDGDEKLPEVEQIPVNLNSRSASPHEASALRIRFRGCTDVLCVSHKEFAATLELEGHSFFGNLGFRRIAADGGATLAFQYTMSDGVCGR